MNNHLTKHSNIHEYVTPSPKWMNNKMNQKFLVNVDQNSTFMKNLWFSFFIKKFEWSPFVMLLVFLNLVIRRLQPRCNVPLCSHSNPCPLVSLSLSSCCAFHSSHLGIVIIVLLGLPKRFASESNRLPPL
jgi:hypothetical protein